MKWANLCGSNLIRNKNTKSAEPKGIKEFKAVNKKIHEIHNISIRLSKRDDVTREQVIKGVNNVILLEKEVFDCLSSMDINNEDGMKLHELFDRLNSAKHNFLIAYCQ